MKISIRTLQVLVALLFIISGLVKANDPMGLSYKMQEFFEIWNAELTTSRFFARGLFISLFDFLHGYSLALSVSMITLEIVAGVALLVGWRPAFILYLLLALILFFTLLTSYAYLSTNPDGSPKFTNCGCFGDCLPITPATSFWKDVVLLLMIVWLLIGQEWIKQWGTSKFRKIIAGASLALTLLLQLYVLNYLPLVDCLPFKKGNNIAEQMKPPPGSIPDSIAIRFIYKKGGKQYEFAPENLPDDFETYTYVNRIDKLVRKGNADPKIKGFSLVDTAGTDYTSGMLNFPKAILIFGLEPANQGQWLEGLKETAKAAHEKNIPVVFATANRDRFARLFTTENVDIPVVACDFTVIRTAARTNPTVYLLKSGTIVDKFGKRNLDDAAEAIREF